MKVPTPSKQHTSVVLVFGGFAVLVLVFRGVWGNAWHALVGHSGAGASSGASSSAAQAASLVQNPVHLAPGSFALEYPTPAAGALPGSAPVPAKAGSSNVHSPAGDPTGEAGTRNIASVSSKSALDVSGGWGVTWTGPGKYEARKFTGVGGSDTRWVRVG